MKQSPDPAEKKAAATVKLHGVTVNIYGPRPDRKKEIYTLSYHVGSKREKQNVKGTLAQAKLRAKEIALSNGAGDIIDLLHLTPLDRRIYLSAKAAVEPLGRAVDQVCRDTAQMVKLLGKEVNLMEVAKFWIAHHATGMPEALPEKVINELFEWMKSKRRSETTIRTLRSIYDRFKADFAIPIAQITTDDLDRWITANDQHSVRTQVNFISAITRLFNYAKGRYLPADAPSAADRLEAPSANNSEPVEIMQPWEMAKLLGYVRDELVPCVALAGFAGLRTIEISRLQWSAIHWADELPAPEPGKPETRETAQARAYPHGFIKIPASVAKQHRQAVRRIIPIQANLAEWLRPYRLKSGPVSPWRTDRGLSWHLWDEIRKLNEREKKTNRPEIHKGKNALRHSYGSYRLPIVESVDALALEMNTSARMIFANYREVVHPSDVTAWWNIRPVEVSTITEISSILSI